uniref:Uncharacterized protein n=1 Tax=viral metagenome TaxID=1070528 RepID=A0A6C0BQC4_9ZZZZ
MSSLELKFNSECDESIAKVLLVHDADNTANGDMVAFFSEMGYHVVLLLLKDTMFKSVRDFIGDFEKLVKAKKDDFVFTVVHYAQSADRDMCMYCMEEVQKNALLLKQAFATLYVVLGRQRCALVAPERCCDFSVFHLPRAQVEGMAIYVVEPPAPCARGPQTTTKQGAGMSLVSAGVEMGDQAATPGGYPREVWDELQAKIDTLRLIDSHKPETQHRRALVEEVVEVQEDPLTLEQLLRLLSKFITSLALSEAFAELVGITAMEFEEYVKRSGDQTVYLILRRCFITLKEDGALTKIADSLSRLAKNSGESAEDTTRADGSVLAEMAQITRDYQASGEVYVSKFPLLSDDHQATVASASRKGPWKAGVEAPEAEAGMHLDKLESRFIPPYMRAALELKEGNHTKTPEEIAEIEKAAAEAARRAQELDREYEKRKLANEIRENNLMGGFSSRERFPSKAQGGECPL